MADRAQEPDVRYRFEHDARAAGQARKQLDPLLSDPDDVIADDVRLATSEMVTNVVAHTDGGGEMRAWDPTPDVPFRVEVEDRSPAPAAIPPDTPEVGGRGLAIVAAISDDWGSEQNLHGKTVWAEFDRDKRRTAAPDEPTG
jgi:anti-sigma regulatory factor (Ser/Thr protein kinase)